MEINNIIDILVQSSQRKKDILKELLAITINQAHLIKEDNLEKLTESIEQKQDLIDGINKVDMLFLDRYYRLKKSLGISSLEQADIKAYPKLKLLRQNTESIMLLLKQINDIDKNNTNDLSQGFEKVKSDMKKLQLNKQQSKVALSYKNKYAGGAQGAFIDNKDKY